MSGGASLPASLSSVSTDGGLMSHPTTRFVLLRHEVPPDAGRSSHWDLLLERDDACWTWALEKLPTDGSGSMPAKRLPDHRKHYLDYEGPVSEGRGIVSRARAGGCEWLEETALRIRVRLTTGSDQQEWLFEQVTGDRWRATANDVAPFRK